MKARDLNCAGNLERFRQVSCCNGAKLQVKTLGRCWHVSVLALLLNVMLIVESKWHRRATVGKIRSSKGSSSSKKDRLSSSKDSSRTTSRKHDKRNFWFSSSWLKCFSNFKRISRFFEPLVFKLRWWRAAWRSFSPSWGLGSPSDWSSTLQYKHWILLLWWTDTGSSWSTTLR